VYPPAGAASLTESTVDIVADGGVTCHEVVAQVVYRPDMRAVTMVERDPTNQNNPPIARDPGYVREIPDRRNVSSREQLLRRVRAEFAELPCLRLTRPQAQRLFGLRPDVCDRVLATLVAEQMICLDPDERYRLPEDAPLNTPKERTAE
jgi:hypothetical protein